MWLSTPKLQLGESLKETEIQYIPTVMLFSQIYGKIQALKKKVLC